jgi:hypothetical protein
MICCAFAALIASPFLVWLRGAFPALLAAFAFFALAALWLAHAEHYLARAGANDRTLLAEIAAAPLCTGSASETNANAL